MTISIQGARENNLQNVSVEIGPGLTVVTGVSGSGKTSLVFDTLYHEARRRFLESFSLPSSSLRLAPARVGAISGLGPAVAVGQNLLNRNPDSNLATASGLHPFLRLLYARFGSRRCPRCAAALAVLSQDELVAWLLALAEKGALTVLAPLLNGVAGSHRSLLALLSQEVRPADLWVDGAPWSGAALNPAAEHDLQVRVAALQPGAVTAADARAAVQRAAALGASALLAQPDGQPAQVRSRAPVCPGCGSWFDDLQPIHFHSACPHCSGAGCVQCAHSGLHPAAAGVHWQGLGFRELLAQPVDAAFERLRAPGLPAGAARLQDEIMRRLEALRAVGLGYITLDRPSPSLSRGEAQRVRLAVALVSRLEDMLHVLDEPTVGQHPADVARLLPAFRRLAGPVVFVEHDRVAAAAADQAIDLGPGAGRHGGQIVFQGTPAGLWAADSPSGRAFSLRERFTLPAPRPAPEHFITVRGARLRNLRQIDVPVPLGRLTVVSGVSGSGKSSLVEDVLAASLAAGSPQGCTSIDGPRMKVVMVDQSPIGLNPRSNPATYTGLADLLRDLFAAETGLSASHFSFNRPEGACPSCEGMGAVEVQMRYLPSTWIPCADCRGLRFSESVLAAQVVFGERRLSIADVFNLPVEEVYPLLDDSPAVGRLPLARQRALRQVLAALSDVGLGYLTLGQPSPTLSGGEAQRVKLTRYLGKGARPGRGEAGLLLVLDEPSTGLHPTDVAGLLLVFDRLVREGATLLVVEHNLDVIRAADWVIDLGPGAGPDGGQLIYSGPPGGLPAVRESLTGQALLEETTLQPQSAESAQQPAQRAAISIRAARANNLQSVSVDFPKSALCVVTGVSGSGKSSLVGDVLEAEARRRFLETLSMYERQGVREGPEAPVDSVSGLGVAVRIGGERGLYDRRATIGTASELSHHLAVLLAFNGQRDCPACAAPMLRVRLGAGQVWRCPACETQAAVGEPRHFLPSNYAAACRTCHGVGTLQAPAPHKLIIHPDLPLCAGAMYSPGFFPKGYLGKPFNGGYDQLQALAARYGFDPFSTPWQEMSPEAQQAFLFGDPRPMTITYHSRSGRTTTREGGFPGFFGGYIRDWDTGGTYHNTRPCPECGGSRLRADFAAVRLGGRTSGELSALPLAELADLLDRLPEGLPDPAADSLDLAAASRDIARRRAHFLVRVGLGYLHLGRLSATLSAGEAQRIRLAGLLGSQLTALTVLLDEPSRGLHPGEVATLVEALRELCSAGNTVVVVEHEPLFMHAADFLVEMGPGAGAAGGQIVASGRPETVLQAATLTSRWLRGERRSTAVHRTRRAPADWLEISGAQGHNLRGEAVRLPLGVLCGVCGVSGSGKSSLVIDTLGRALAPRKQTTSVAREPIDPLPYNAIHGAPKRVVLVDQTRAGLRSPAAFLGLDGPLIALFAASEDARALGLDAARLARRCSACGGSGAQRLEMGFLPAVVSPCETCRGTGFLPEAWDVHLGGRSLPELFSLTISEVNALLRAMQAQDRELPAALLHALAAADAVGLGYLVLNQPGFSLSGGEAQRLKIAAELLLPAALEKEPARRKTAAKRSSSSLYMLDEPTIGQHLEDVERLAGVLHHLVDAGHSVLVVEHHPHLLAACDWLVELGPGSGPQGGRVIAAGSPESLAAGATPIAPYLRAVLEDQP